MHRPEHLAAYGRHAASNVRFFDMAEYTSSGHATGGNVAQLQDLRDNHGIPLRQLAPAVGLVDTPGHMNASCEGWPTNRPRCANLSDPVCGCFDYGWNETSFWQFVHAAEALGYEEIDVYRADAAPPPGTSAEIPAWFIDALAGFLERGRPSPGRVCH
jgi:hypothetical protein